MVEMFPAYHLVISAPVLLTAVQALPYFPGQIRRADVLLPSYDYVIVGGGASGLTIANRLSEDSAVQVLVVEAGGFDTNEDFVTVPGLAGGAVGTKYDWNTTYAPNDALGGRKVSIPQGKVVGGSTKLNRMVYDRGSKSDCNRWEELGNTGWNWESFLKYFKKTEIFTPPSDSIVSEYNVKYDPSLHSTEGKVHATYSPWFWPTTKNIASAFKELNIHMPQDQGNGDAYGGYFCPHNQVPETAQRSSAREAYYESAKTRSNLHLVTNTQVMKLLFKNQTGTASVSSVQFASAGTVTRGKTIAASKEVILAAGTLHTPQILQISGIGDPRHLATIDVAPVVKLPAVGHNLHDHILLPFVIALKNATIQSSLLTSNATFMAEAQAEYDDNKTGPLSTPTGDFLGFLPLTTYTNASASLAATATSQDPAKFLAPDTPAEVSTGYAAQHSILAQRLKTPTSALLEVIWSDSSIVLGLQQPFSRGMVQAASQHIHDAPLADPRLLSNPLDIKFLVEGIKWARNQLLTTNAISELQPTEILPGANVTTDAALEAYVRQNAGTLFHPAGSCKLGAREDGGVVDQELKVYGVDNLRVVDASIMPFLPASHAMTTVYAVAEKAADIIRGQNSAGTRNVETMPLRSP